jgi:hypothetical protein
VALGTAKLFGFRLRRNFSYPYFARTPVEFWRRWHISLSTWFRDYLFIPLGGSRVGPARLFFNVALTFLLSGLWHGAQWTFVVWGALHALAAYPFLHFRRLDRATSGGATPAAIAGVLGTFLFVTLAWVPFRAESVADAVLIWGRMAGVAGSPVAPAPLVDPLGSGGHWALIAGMLLVEWCGRRNEHPLVLERWPRPVRWAAYTALLWIALLLGSPQSRPFIYFQF